MTGRVAQALFLHELHERLRDRWVLVVTTLFVALVAGVGLYGRGAEQSAVAVTAPSVVTLATFLVPLIALILGHDAIVGERERNTLGLLLSLPVGRGEVLLAKFGGRATALLLSTTLGLSAGFVVLEAGQREVVWTLLGPTLLLGASFLSMGLLISVVAQRHATAASLAVVTWFGLVFFYDLGILAALVASDGALGNDTVAALVVANPAGLYRTSLLMQLGGGGLADLGSTITLPGAPLRAALWATWIVAPLGLGAALLSRRQAVRA